MIITFEKAPQHTYRLELQADGTVTLRNVITGETRYFATPTDVLLDLTTVEASL